MVLIISCMDLEFLGRNVGILVGVVLTRDLEFVARRVV